MMMMMTMMVIHLHDVIKGPRECQFGFHHAELSQVMTRVGILGTESRTESVYFRHCTEVKHSKEHILAKNTARLHQWHATTWTVMNLLENASKIFFILHQKNKKQIKMLHSLILAQIPNFKCIQLTYLLLQFSVSIKHHYLQTAAKSINCTPLLWQTTSQLRWLSRGKRGDYQNCSVLYCVLKLCLVKR